MLQLPHSFVLEQHDAITRGRPGKAGRKMMRRRTLIALGILMALAGGLWLLIGAIRTPATAYTPNDYTLRKLEKLTQVYGVGNYAIGSKVLTVGAQYREGDIAYFSGSRDYWTMGLEEWRRQKDSTFRVTNWLFFPDKASRWVNTVSSDRRLLDAFQNKTELDIRDPETNVKSVFTQRLLIGKSPVIY